MPATFSYSSPFDLVDGHTHTYYLNIPAGTWTGPASLEINGMGFASTPGGTVPVIQMHWLPGSPFYVPNAFNAVPTGINYGLTFTVSTPGHTQSAGNNQFLQNSGGYGGGVQLDVAFNPEFIAGCQVTIVATMPPSNLSPGNYIVARALTALIIVAGTLTQPAPVFGCTDPSATNYNPGAVVNDGSCLYPVGGGSGGGTTPVPGCTNPAAINYNPAATVDNGTCILPVPGCMNPGATNYNPAATVDNGSCVFPATPGCTNPAAINYNPSATSDNGSCILPVRGCTLAGSLNYNPAANVNDGSCIPIVLGCTVPGTLNYNALANKDDGSCVFGLAPADPAPLASCCVWGGDLLLASAWAGDLLSTCVWGPDLLLVSAWTSTDYCPAPVPVAPAPAAVPAYYGIANDPYSLGNDPLGVAQITPDTSTPIVPAGPLAYYSIGNEPLLILP